MPVFIGILFGRAVGVLLGRLVFSHAMLTVIVWYGLSGFSFWLAYENLGLVYGRCAAVLALAALLAWTLRRPAESRVKLWLFDCFYVWTRLGIAWAVIVAAFRLLAEHGSLARWMPIAWPYLLAGVGFWLAQRAVLGWLLRSHIRAGDLSLAGE